MNGPSVVLTCLCWYHLDLWTCGGPWQVPCLPKGLPDAFGSAESSRGTSRSLRAVCSIAGPHAAVVTSLFLGRPAGWEDARAGSPRKQGRASSQLSELAKHLHIPLSTGLLLNKKYQLLTLQLNFFGK